MARTRSRISASTPAYSRGTLTLTSRKRWLTPRTSTVTRAPGASALATPYPVMLRTALPGPAQSPGPRPGLARGPDGREQLGRAHRGRADLPHHDPRGMVGEHGGFLEAAPRAETEGERRHHRVAGPGDIEHLARHGGEFLDCPARLKEREPALAPRHEHGARLPALEQPTAGGVERGRIGDVDASGRRGLFAVRLDQRGAAVVGEVAALGIDEPGKRLPAVHVGERVQELGVDRALAVIRHDEHVGRRAGTQHEVPQPPADGAIDGRDFPIEADHLLVAGDDAGLLRGLAPRDHDHPVGARTARPKRGHEPPPRGVVADNAADRHPSPEGSDVARNVARAARPRVVRHDADDRHGRLGRDALDLAPEELVEHQIADDKNAHAGEAPHEPPQGLASDPLHRALSSQASVPSALCVTVYRASTRARPAAPSRARSPGSAPRRASALPSAAASPGGTRSPVTSSTTTSASPPTRLATTGRPAAIASNAANPTPSCREGSATTSAAARHAATSVRNPTKRTALPSDAAARPSASRSLPSPQTT